MTQEFQQIFQFLSDLEHNNNREWFAENKPIYQKALQGFEQIVGHLSQSIHMFDASIETVSPKKYIFRIYRDTRFSHNKEPYKNNFGAFIAPGGRSSGMAGYYIHLQNNNSFVGGGVYMPPSDKLKAIRTEVLYHHQEFETLLKDADFQSYFGGLAEMDQKLKRPPKGFPADHPAIELAKHKSYVCAMQMSNDDFYAPDSMKKIVGAFSAMKMFNEFLNRSIESLKYE